MLKRPAWWRRRAPLASEETGGPSASRADALTLFHELRTPLTLILGPLENALDGFYGEVGDPLREALGLARRSAQTLLRRMDQLLTLAQAEEGGLELQRRRLDLVRFLEHQVALFGPVAERRGIELGLVPQGEARLWADAERLEQVVANLLSNALRHTPPGGRVTITVSSAERWSEVAVADSGCGIPADELPHLFDLFYRSPNQGSRRGAGVGLALVRELVSLHGGSISVESSPGEGSVFRVRLPEGTPPTEEVRFSASVAATPGTTAALAVALAEPEPEEPPGQEGDGPLVLLVDDEPAMRHFVRECLGKGYRYREAQDGAEGLALLDELEVAVVVSDVTMPRVDGFELTRRVRERAELDHLAVVLLTARSDLPSRLQGLDLGADDYVPKPFSRRELASRVANLVARRERLHDRYRERPEVRVSEIAVTPLDERFLERLVATVESHIDDRHFGVAELASAVAMSPRNLQRKIKAVVGVTPNALLRDLRLQRAAQLLEQRAASVGEIAYQVGFSDSSSFSRAFHRRYGRPPSEWK